MHLVRILPLLQSSEIRPLVITLTHKGELASRLESVGIIVLQPPLLIRMLIRIPIIKGLLGVPLTLCYLLYVFVQTPACMTGFYLPASYLLGGLTALLTRQAGRTVMFRRSQNKYQNKKPFVRFIERQLHKYQSVIVANSRAILNELMIDEGVSESRLRLIYNGVDVNSYGDQSARLMVRAELGIPDSALVLCYVANLLPYKGHLELIHALALASDRLPNGWILLCVGAGLEKRPELSALVRKYQLQDHIIWLGIRNDVDCILSAVDIGLQVSQQEGFSNAVLEGMASGLPMIVTDVGGNGEAVEHEVSGIIVNPYSVTELADAIVKLCNNPEQAHQYGVAARMRVKTLFSLGNVVTGYRQLIAELCE